MEPYEYDRLMGAHSVGSCSEDGDGNETEVGRPNESAGATYDSTLRPGASSGVGEGSRESETLALRRSWNLGGYLG